MPAQSRHPSASSVPRTAPDVVVTTRSFIGSFPRAQTRPSAVALARQFEDAGVSAIIYTDIARDGTGQGLNVEETCTVASAVSVPVIASGGIGGLSDLEALKQSQHPNIAGAICGRALYDGRPEAVIASLSEIVSIFVNYFVNNQ